MRPLSCLSAALRRIEGRPYHPASVLLAVLFVGAGRALEEAFLGHGPLRASTASQHGAFYLTVLFGFTAIAALLLKTDWRSVSKATVWGIFFGLVPPLIDVFWLGLGRFRYNYLGGFEWTLHGSGNPYSEAIVGWSGLGVLFFYIWIRSGSVGRAAVGLVLAHAFLLVAAVKFPDSFKSALGPVKGNTVRTVLYLCASYAIYVALHAGRFRSSLSRVNRSLPWPLLVLLGASLVGRIGPMTWLQALVVLFVHQGIVFANDYYDRVSDQINQRASRLDRNDALLIQVLIVWMAVHVYLASPALGGLLLLYILVATAYHHPALRLKMILPVAYGIEGLVAVLAFLIGMASVDHTLLSPQDLVYLGFAFVGFFLGSPFKDYKDIPGDRASKTRTLYVCLEDRGWPLPRIHALTTGLTVGLMAFPAVFLFLRGVEAAVVFPAAALFMACVFAALRLKDKTAAVERTVWSLAGYLAVLVVLSQPSAAQTAVRLLRDFEGSRTGAETYMPAYPATVGEVVEIVRQANRDKVPIRIRGKGHSMNGSSLPRTGEILLLTDRLRGYRFEEPGSVTVGGGIPVHELESFLEGRGWRLPVVNDGKAGPTVGGYIAAGGIGQGSKEHGGFWENVLQMTLVSGLGDVLILRPDDELFPWIFGSMGQLGIVVSAKLKVLGEGTASYPLREKGEVPESNVEAPDPLIWFTLFVPNGEIEAARREMERIRLAHPRALRYLPDYTYPIAFKGGNPPLVFPREEDFSGVGIWGKPVSRDASAVEALERDVTELVAKHRETPYRRYIQTETAYAGTDYRSHFGPAVYDAFLRLKERLDPHFLLACGTVFACREPD